MWRSIFSAFSDCFNNKTSNMEEEKEEEEISPSKAAALGATLRNHRGQPIFPGEIRQSFSLPESIIYYIAMHPSNAEVYKKLIRTCKYFYNQNPILVINGMSYMETADNSGAFEWKVSFKKSDVPTIDMDIVPCKLWVTNFVFTFIYGKLHESDVVSIVQKIYRCDAKYLGIKSQVLTLNDLLLLGSNAKHIGLFCNNITVNDGKNVVQFEKIIEKLPKLRELRWGYVTEKCFSPNTVAELLKIQHFGNITSLQLDVIPEIFDAKALFEAVKMKHKNMRVELSYDVHEREFSTLFKQKIDGIVNEIITTEVFTYKPPLIYYVAGNDWNKFDKMKEIYERYENTQF